MLYNGGMVLLLKCLVHSEQQVQPLVFFAIILGTHSKRNLLQRDFCFVATTRMRLTSCCLQFPGSVGKNSSNSSSPFTVFISFILLFVFFEKDLEDLSCDFSATGQDLFQRRVTLAV